MAEFMIRIGGIARKSGRIGGPGAENRGAAVERRSINSLREREMREAVNRDMKRELMEGGVFEKPANHGDLISASYGPKCILTLRYASGKRKSKYVSPSAEKLQAQAASA